VNSVCRGVLLCVLFAASAVFSIALTATAAEPEVVLSAEELKKVDTFEGHTLAKADQTFSKKQYRQARTEYDSFIIEFPNSKLIPYALLRKGRCAQLDDKRFKAVADYDEILDYFPNDVKYAAAALYYIGDCHSQNGDLHKAMKAWAEMADDKEYRHEALAAFAINHLADLLLQQDKESEAAKYYEQVAVTFRTSNHDASRHALGPVIRYYVRTNPDEPKFREFYTNMRTFEHHPRTVPGDLTENKPYWDCLRHYIRQYGNFDTTSSTPAEEAEVLTEQRKKYYAYWSGQMQGKFTGSEPYDDDFQIELADFRYRANGDRAAWFTMLDQRYNKLGQQGGWQRTLKWMNHYTEHAAKVEQYFRKVDLARTENEGVVELMRTLWKVPDTRPLAKELIDRLKPDQMSSQLKGSLAVEFYEDNQVATTRLLGMIDFAKVPGRETGSLARSFWSKDPQLSKHIVGKIRFDLMEDREIAGVARGFWQLDGGVVREVCMRTKDKNYGKSELLSYYQSHWGWNPTEGLPVAEDLTKIEKYAEQAWWAKGEFLHALKQYAKAIGAYRNCQNEPTNLWRIADCQVKLGKLDSAVTQCREIENFFPNEAPKAVLHIAYLYRNAKEERKFVMALREVLKKYPQSNESRQAHLELEKLGYKMGGGIDAN